MAAAPTPAQLALRATWVPDTAAPSCHICKATFSLFTRRHHCRGCGQVFCGSCSKNTIALPLGGFEHERVRACTTCYTREVQRLDFEKVGVVMLQTGEVWKKHPNGIGMPRMRLIQLTPDRQFITWTREGKAADGGDKEERGSMPLSDITDAKESSAKKTPGMHGMAIFCRARTLELEIGDKALRDRWVKALKEARIFVKAPTSGNGPKSPSERKEQQRAAEEEKRAAAEEERAAIEAEREADDERRRQKEENKRRRTELRDKYRK